MNGSLMSKFLNYKHACSGSFSSSLCAAAVSCHSFLNIFSILPSAIVYIYFSSSLSARSDSADLEWQRIYWHPILFKKSYSTSSFYSGPTAHCIADLLHWISESILINLICQSPYLKARQYLIITDWCLQISLIIKPILSTTQSCRSLISIL